MNNKRAAAVAEESRLDAHAALIDQQLEEAKTELQEVRQSSVVHKERADRSHARLTVVNKEHIALDDTATKLEAAVQVATGEVAALRVQKEQLVEQAEQVEEELRPLKQRKGALDTTVSALRESNVALNAQLQTSSEDMMAGETNAATEQARMETAKNARKDLEEKVSQLQDERKVTTEAITTLDAQVQSLSQTVDSKQDQQSIESAEMGGIVSKSAGLETELETLRAHSNMSATQQADALTQCGARCEELHAQEQQLLRESSVTEGDMKKLQATADDHAEKLASMAAEATDHATRRHKLRVAISELKGNVRVVCRVCPNNGAEPAATTQSGSVTSGPSSTGVDDTISVLPPPSSDEPADGQAFVFDRVLQAQATNDEVFQNIADLVERAAQGENVCVYSCGHSSSGKASMLSGISSASGAPTPATPATDDDGSKEKTLLSQALEHLLKTAALRNSDSDWTHSISASMAILNGDGMMDALSEATDAIETPLNVDGTVSLANLTWVPSHDQSAFLSRVSEAAATQGAAGTDAFHKVLTVEIRGECDSQTTRTGCLRFIELAGTGKYQQQIHHYSLSLSLCTEPVHLPLAYLMARRCVHGYTNWIMAVPQNIWNNVLRTHTGSRHTKVSLS